MNENSFVAVGRIERIATTSRGLTLIIGGAGPVKSLVAVQLRDAALLEVVTTPGSKFAAGDIVSVGGSLEFDPETLQNVAVASPARVSRIARGPAAAVGPAAQAAAAAVARGGGFFGHCASPVPKRSPERLADIPPLPDGFPSYLTGAPLSLDDVPN